MKILHINKFFDVRGGAETILHATMERQRRLGHTVHAFATRSPQNLPSTDAARFVERFDYAIREGWEKDLRKSISFIWNREARRAVERMLAELRPDVIHLHNIYHHLSSSILGPIRASRVPCVQTLHDYKLACPNYKMFTEGATCERCKGGRYVEAIRHHCLSSDAAGNILAAVEMGMTKAMQSYERTVRIFICPSQYMAEKMAAWGEPPAKLTVIPNAVDLPQSIASRDGGYLLCAGRLSSEKGIDTLIRAMAKAPSLKLKIAGIGPEEARLRMLATSLNASNVEFLGFVRRSEQAHLWQRAAALVAPSVWYENAPLAVLEAMADGLPILASRIGGLPEMVAHGKNGLLIDAGNVDAWIHALRTFVQLSDSERARMAFESRRIVEQVFTWEQHLKALFAAYQRAGASIREHRGTPEGNIKEG